MPKLKSNIDLNQLNQQLVKTLCKELGIQPIVATLLVSRGIKNTEMARNFLFPNSINYCNPYELPNMERITMRIQQAIDKNEKIVIYGDYDVDGITASTILFIALTLKSASNVNVCIPDRHVDGYGLNLKQIEKLKDEGTSLLITVDCGITAHDEIIKCNEYNIDVIVSDHHQLPDHAVPAYAMTNPLMLDSTHSMRHLCGAGVAFKIGQALNGIEKMERLSQYAAIATIADIVSATGENRLIVYRGLEQLNKQPYPGVAELIEVSRLKMNAIRSEHIAFGLAPRINAAGRMDSPYSALNLFLEKDTNKRKLFAKRLNELNNERKKSTQKAFDEAEAQLTEAGTIQKQLCLMAYSDWNPGVIGIAASKILEVHYRPTILFAKKGDVLTGSARSITGINIYLILKECSHLFEKFGGHSAAAGITMKIKYFEEFKKLINQKLQSRFNEDIFRRMVHYDLVLDSFQLNSDTVRQIEMLEPFGEGNPKPIFLTRKMGCSSVKKIGKNRQHLRFDAMLNNMSKINCVFFNAKERTYDYLIQGNEISAIGELNINSWNGRQKLQFMVKEIVGTDYYNYMEVELVRRDFISIFVWLKKLQMPIVIKSRKELYQWYREEGNENVLQIKFQVIINIFNYVNIIDINEQKDNLIIELKDVNTKVDLEKNSEYIEYQNYARMF